MGSKPLISEQENGLAIKLEREGEFIALSHFTFHGYFTSVLIYICQSESYHWHCVLLPEIRSLSYRLSSQIFRAPWLTSLLGPEREFLCGLGQWGAIMIWCFVSGYSLLWIFGARIVSWQAPATDLCPVVDNTMAASELGGNTPELQGKSEPWVVSPRPVPRPHQIFIAELVTRVSTSDQNNEPFRCLVKAPWLPPSRRSYHFEFLNKVWLFDVPRM